MGPFLYPTKTAQSNQFPRWYTYQSGEHTRQTSDDCRGRYCSFARVWLRRIHTTSCGPRGGCSSEPPHLLLCDSYRSSEGCGAGSYRSTAFGEQFGGSDYVAENCCRLACKCDR